MSTNEPIAYPSYNPAEINDSGLLTFTQDNLLTKLEKVAPAKIISYDRATNRASVQILQQNIYSTGDKLTLKPLSDIPVLILCGGGYSISFPIGTGDTGWIVAADRNISIFKQFLSVFTPATYRKHKYEDGFFIPDKVNGFEISSDDTNALLITSTDGNTKISIINGQVTVTSSAVAINGDVTVSGSITAQGDVTAGGISLISHIHSGVETGSGTTGTAQ
ncbi:MAG: hypothetical protein LUE98_21230 [Tannerellaceae bacterium]|nr:hypothetical protein [Tannerellaceae bacterium]